MPPALFKNTLLKSLSPEVIERLSLRPVTFPREHEIEFPGTSIQALSFIEEGLASMSVGFSDGSEVEVGMFGYESVIGASALMGVKRSPNRVSIKIAGYGYSCPIEVARVEFELCGELQQMILRHLQAQLTLTAQTAACNAKHNIEQRLARWLLLCCDRTLRESYNLSQDALADMLGVTRPTISLAAGILKDEGLIDYSRGIIRIIDGSGLEKKACECYRTIKNHLDNYIEFDGGIAV